LSEIGTENILEAVVVVVADANRGGPTGRSQAGLLGDISECAVAIVLVKPVCRPGGRGIQANAREEKNIHPPVIVIINESTAAPGGLQNVLLAFYPAIDHRRMEASRGCHIDKMRVERPA
jgi:hypothetical protein